MKPIWKKLLAAGCAAVVLITSQGVPVEAAADMYETQAETLLADEVYKEADIVEEASAAADVSDEVAARTDVNAGSDAAGSDVNIRSDAALPDGNIQPNATGLDGTAQPGSAESEGTAQPDVSELEENAYSDAAQFDAAGPEAADGADGVDSEEEAFAEEAEEALVGATGSTNFSDVQDPKHPYYKAICWAAETGITKGYEDGTFGVDRACTRSEVMMFLWRMAGKPLPKIVSNSPFSDVPKTHAHYWAILWASQKGITKGYSDGTFGPDKACTRGECMMFIWRFKGKPLPKLVSESPFSDLSTKHDFYWAIVWGSQKKITNGFADGTFRVDEKCTRGQIVTFLYRTIPTGWVKVNGEQRYFDAYGRMLDDSKVPPINYLTIMSTSKKTNQIIMVVGHNLMLFSKANGRWTKVISSYCGYGQNGFKLANERREGDKTTPIGSFTLPLAFGPGKNPGTSMTYRQITKNSYWSGDYDTYNTWVESSYRVPGEHLIDYEEYKYAMAIGFNMNPTVYKRGSAIFLHCKSADRWYTSGCVSVPEDVMLTLMKKTKNGAYMVIVPERTMLRNY